MAAGDTALAVKTSSPPPTDHDDSVVSSPLSDVEDKDGDVDELDEEHGDAQQPHADASDDDSNLSDANDSEAETERLYHTPKSVGRGGSESVGNQFTDRQVPERSPSKLQNEIRVDKDKQKGDDEPEEAASDDERSSLASATLKAAAKSTKSEDVPLKTIEEVPKAEPETRKRKRSPVADQSESEQPLRKRTGSVATGKDGADEDTTMADEEPAASNAHSGDASPGEDEQPADAEEAADRAEEADADATATKTKKSKRNSPRTRKEGSHGDDAPEEEAAEALEDPPEGSATGGADDEAAAKPDEEQAEAEAEEDAEEAAKNAEERKSEAAAVSDVQY